jgi:hypothetical protein
MQPIYSKPHCATEKLHSSRHSSAECWRATARIADLIIAGNEGQFATRSANSVSIAALFAAPCAESLDFSAESAIVRSLS